MAKALIPRVNPMMLRDQPDQFCQVINEIIDKLNTL